MTANKKTIDFGYTKTMLKTDQNNPVVKEYVDAMKRGTNPNPTEKKTCYYNQCGVVFVKHTIDDSRCTNPTEKSMIQKKKITLHKTKEYATDVIPNPTVESWEKELNNLIYKYNQGKIAGNPTWSQEAIEKGNAYAFSGITSKMQKKLQDLVRKQIQQAEERLVEKIKKEYNKRYQKIAKEHGLKRKTPHTMFHDVLATLKEEK